MRVLLHETEKKNYLRKLVSKNYFYYYECILFAKRRVLYVYEKYDS